MYRLVFWSPCTSVLIEPVEIQKDYLNWPIIAKEQPPHRSLTTVISVTSDVRFSASEAVTSEVPSHLPFSGYASRGEWNNPAVGRQDFKDDSSEPYCGRSGS